MALAAGTPLAAQLQSFKVKFQTFRGGIKGPKNSSREKKIFFPEH